MFKGFYFLLLCTLCVQQQAVSQLEYQWQGITPTTMKYNDVQMIDSDLVVGVGLEGTFIRSADGGQNWTYQYVSVPLDLNEVEFLSSDTGYVCGSTYGYTAQSVLRTFDGGNVWHPISMPEIVDFYALDFVSSDTGWVVGQSGKIYRTTDGGESWTNQSLSVAMDIKTIFMLNADTGFVAGTTTLYRTVNGGINWNALSSMANCNDIQFRDSLHGIAMLSTSKRRTLDGGITWTSVQGEEGTAATYATDDLIFAVTPVAICKSTNAGAVFSCPNNLYHQGTCIDFYDAQHGVVLGIGGSIQRTTDGGVNWVSIAGRSNYNNYNAIQFVDIWKGWCVGEGGIIMRTNNGGQDWENIGSTTGGLEYQDLYFVNENLGYVVGGNKVLKTTNGGNTLTTTTVGASNITFTAVWFYNSSIGWITGSQGVVYKTINGGSTWTLQTLPIYTLSTLDIFFLDQNIGFIVGYGNRVFKTIDGGNTWVDIMLSLGVSNLNHIQFLNENEGWASGDVYGMAHTTNGGATWQVVNFPCTNPQSFYFVNDLVGYAITDQVNWNCHFYQTLDGGQTWQNIPLPISYNMVGIHVVGEDNVYICGEYGTIVHVGDMDYFEGVQAVDFDGNDDVGISDLNLLIAHFGCTQNCAPYDLDGDGIVSTDDFAIFMYYYN
jgi:photosystem II stability/assembly factor-like uncharacterized protein